MLRLSVGRVHLVVAAVVALAAASVLTLPGLPGVTTFGPLAGVLTLTALVVWTQMVPFVLPRGDDAEEIVLDEAVVAVALACLPPAGVLVVLIGGSLGSNLLRRIAPLKAIFNVAAHALGAVLAVNLQALVAPGAGRPLSGAWLVGVALGILGYWAAVNIAVWWVISVVSDEPFGSLLRRSIPWGAATAGLGATGGIGVGIAVSAVGWMGGLAAATPLLLLQRLQAAQRDQSRLTALLRLATSTSGERSAAAIEEATCHAAKEVLGVDAVEVRTSPPEPHERGAALGPDGRWVVARRGHRLLAAGARAELDVLEAVANVGKIALDRALLVARLERDARTDPLTQLPNRSAFAEATARLISGESTVAVLVCDLDRFKRVNDSLGHRVGDMLLCQVAARLPRAAGTDAVVARMGGDEFTIVAAGVDAPALAQRILRCFDEPFRINHHELFVTTSVGIAVYPLDGDTPTSLLRVADRALYRAKEQGRNTYRYFDGATSDGDDLLALEHDLHIAIAEEALSVEYQPVVAEDGLVVGAEALVRWTHATHGRIPPDRFLPIAEEAGLIATIDAWVMDRAVAQLATWERPDLRMAVNVSARTLSQPTFVADTLACVQRHGVDPRQLEIEITEQTATSEPEMVIDRLRLLRRDGIAVAIDDFGIGYSSLGRLDTFPIDRLKIDRSFVSPLGSGTHTAVVPLIVAMAHALNLRVTAEGVETDEQRGVLAELGCDDYQGWLFSRPLTPDDFALFLARPRMAPAVRIG